LLRFRAISTLAAVAALAGPMVASAKPVGNFDFIVADPGDQTDPSIDGQFIVYSGPGQSGDKDILLYDVLDGRNVTLAGGPGDQDSPDISFLDGVFRGPGGIWVVSWYRGTTVRRPVDDGIVAAPSIGDSTAAWERGSPGNRDVVVYRFGGVEYALSKPGDQHSPAVAGHRVAYVDGGDAGAVWLHDAIDGSSRRFVAGRASGVALGLEGSSGLFAAIARGAPGEDDDIEVYDVDGSLLAALAVAGVQRNPHISGEWVAFEDLSTSFSQVIVWNWRTGLVFVPRPSETNQTLNDVSMGDAELRVVFEDSASADTGRDIALFRLPTDPIPDDGEPVPWPPPPPPPPPPVPARCDDPDARVLATLELGRGTGRPLAGRVRFSVDVTGADPLPVLVCIDADRVSAAWITLDGEAVATPCDFNPQVVHLEIRSELDDGRGCLAGILAGKPGATLTARVLADPPVPAATSVSPPDVAATPSATSRQAVKDGAGAGTRETGCGTGGGAGGGVLLAVAWFLARLGPRREP